MKNLIFILVSFSFLFSSLAVELIGSKFDKPIYLLSMPSQKNELLIVEQKGVIKTIKNGKKNKTPFLDITDRVHRPLFPGDERGFLGIAFDPNFVKNGYFYVNYINKSDSTIISRFTYENNTVNHDSEKIILAFEQPYSNHNGGCMQFDKEGYLFISVGDGGSSGDPENRAQDLSSLFGKILRIDINTKDEYLIPNDNPFVKDSNYRKEIWSYGFRNVWRFSFDALTNDMILADVGQHLWEEINFETFGSKGGLNYGWNILEGNHCFPEDTECSLDGTVAPIFEYPNNANYAKTLFGIKQPDMDGCSITGGYVYRGSKIKDFYGKYIFGDYCTGKIWSLRINQDGEVTDFYNHTDELLKSMNKREFYLSSFGQDESNEIYLIDYNGDIYKIVNED